MAHETHHEEHHPADNQKSKTSLSASFWFVLILVFLFIAAVNFVNVMSHDSSEGHGEGHKTEATHDSHNAGSHNEHATEANRGEAAPTGHSTTEENHSEGGTDHTEGH